MRPEQETIPRRTFLDRLLVGGILGWAAGFLAPVLSYVWPAQRRGPGVQSVSAGKAKDFEPWSSRMAAVGGHPIIVVNTPQGFRAFSAICTHLGCIVNWNAERRQIACPCHAGFFDVNGRPVAGPPPSPLPEHQVLVVDGEVMVRSE
jgi:cytochrome b6-f complex iron-sulfur subunit